MTNPNVEGLIGSAQKKRQETFDKVDKGIQQLLKERKVINFNTVAEASGVSKAWLYKEPEIKARIEHLRVNNSKPQQVPPKQKPSDASQQSIVKTLKERIRRVEAENRGLRDQNEEIYGRIIYMSELEQRVERLEKENASLKKQLAERESTPVQFRNPNPRTNTSPVSSVIDSQVELELEELGIPLNSTLEKTIKSTSTEAALQAIVSLKEALLTSEVRNMSGFLVAAITNSWKPNQDFEKKKEVQNFNEWFPLARTLRLVVASTMIDNVQHVLTSQDEWIPFEQIIVEYPLSRLKGMAEQK